MSTMLIIGADSDVAKSAARRFAMKGYDLYLTARTLPKIDSLATDIHIRSGRNVKCFELDVLDYARHHSFYTELPEQPDAVLVAVGYLGNQELAQTDFQEAQKIIHTNFTGIVSVLNMIAEDFQQRKSGTIAAISSVAGDRGRQSNYFYGAAKGALTLYLSGLRNRMSKHNVHVLTIKPGFINTKMTEGLDLPEKLTASPEQVADDIVRAVQKKKNVIYTLWMWRYIMLIIRHIPEVIFKRLSL